MPIQINHTGGLASLYRFFADETGGGWKRFPDMGTEASEPTLWVHHTTTRQGYVCRRDLSGYARRGVMNLDLPFAFEAVAKDQDSLTLFMPQNKKYEAGLPQSDAVDNIGSMVFTACTNAFVKL